MLELILFGISALFGSGILFAHKRMLTYIGLAGVLFQTQFILISLLARTYLQEQNRTTIFLVAGIIFCTIWIALYKKWTSPYATPGSGLRDAFVGIVLLVITAAAYPIIEGNGYIGEDFVLHGFYNGDVVTFASLIQKSFDTTSLVSQNPLSGNGALEYPTVLHGSFADFFTLLGIRKDWLHYLDIMTYVGIFLTIPLFFLVWDSVWPEPANPAEKWFGVPSRAYVYALQTLLTLFAIGISFDSFAYPQSHFFLWGIELASIALFVTRSFVPATIAATMLLLSNAVTGTTAAALAGIFSFIRIFDKKRSPLQRALFLVFGIIVLYAMSHAASGRTAFNDPHFSLTSANEMLRVGLPVVFVFFASIFSLSRKQFNAVATLMIAVLGFGTFALSNRDIVTENASRFLYHSFLIGFPLLLPFLIQGIYATRRELLLTLRPMSELIAGWVGVICIIAVAFLPVGISVGTTYASLTTSEAYTIGLQTRTALWWIDEHAAKEAIIITSPQPPYIIPLYTGRAVLRLHDYWLSEQDETMRDTSAAFLGDIGAQQRIIKKGQYLFLSKNDREMWDVSGLKKVFEAPDAIVYKTL